MSASEGSTECCAQHLVLPIQRLERRRRSVFVMLVEGLAGRWERRRSGADPVVGDCSLLDHEEWILISDEEWVAKSHILLNVHCESNAMYNVRQEN